MGVRRCGISLRVFNSIAYEWAQRTSKMSSWTREEKFHIYKQPCIILFILQTQSPFTDKKSSRKVWTSLKAIQIFRYFGSHNPKQIPTNDLGLRMVKASPFISSTWPWGAKGVWCVSSWLAISNTCEKNTIFCLHYTTNNTVVYTK